MIRLVLALAALLFLAPIAEAASFDCGKAATSFEKAICSSPELSQQDEILAQAYATALGGLSKVAAGEVKATQHDWLGYAERICSDDAEPIKGTYTDDQALCLTGSFKGRVRALEASRMQGGYRFYPVGRYLVEKDTEATADDYTKIADKQYETVRIDRDDDIAKAFNAMIEAMRSDHPDLFETGTDKLAGGDVTEDILITTTVDAVTDKRISLVTDNYWFGHGAAHPNYGISYKHFLVDAQRPLYASDIFSGKTWKAVLGKLVLDKLQGTLEDGVWEDSIKDVPDWSADPARWNFSPEGLLVQFQPYEVTYYAAGAPAVTIPWDALSDIMASGAEEIAAY
ncbi:MAG: DUF3298 domain-containing protein [Devosia nanyangense]|uniref:DUF3298 domain-containing protein n=1 Tax=Devosia nanyangense TaxID=1228055 RepID=A0A933L430_9HYPH|nr:DUF3298 domain-containing protein [Devosia nanyangense]